MLANEAEKKEKKSDYFKDILIALMVLVIALGVFLHIILQIHLWI